MKDRELFLAALDIEDPLARRDYLRAECAGDADLLARVESLLASHEGQSLFLITPVVEQIAEGSEAGNAATLLAGSGNTHEAPNDPNATVAHHASGSAAMTNLIHNDSNGGIPLEFLEPSTKPGSLGLLGHYEVLEVVGRGAFGTVLRAFDEKLQRIVAIKVMSPEIAATSPARKRFLREAQASAAIRHEHVVSIYAVEEKPIPYLVMEYIPGLTLQQRLDQQGPLDLLTVLRLGRQIAEGLAAAHAQELIHRDIKPSNILLETSVQDRVKITDFGLARAADDASQTQSGFIAGTPMYMAPEQALDRTLDQRADLFSLGSVLYQMVSGRPPFRANGTLAVMKRVAEDTPRPIREIIVETPEWLCAIIAKLHAKNPDERYQSAQEVADVLADCESQLKANAKLQDFSRIPRSGNPLDSWRRKWGLVTLISLILPIAAWGIFGSSKRISFSSLEKTELLSRPYSPDVPASASDVLAFLKGNWKVERKYSGPLDQKEKATSSGYYSFGFVANKMVLRGHGSFGSGEDAPLLLYTYDPGTNSLNHWQAWEKGDAVGPSLGLFNPTSWTLTWIHRFPNNVSGTHEWTFVDEDTIRTKLTRTDAANKIIGTMDLTFQRVSDVVLLSVPNDPRRSEETKVFDQLVGEWRNETTIRNLEPPGAESLETGTIGATSILGGRFFELITKGEMNNSEDYALAWFDADTKQYRQWYFSGNNYTFELTGTLEKSTETLEESGGLRPPLALHWQSADNRLSGNWTFRTEGVREFTHQIKAPDGSVKTEMKGVSRRIESSAKGMK